jgi:protein-S-isoprenylcysteine O-methyltransferase Ste14
MSGFPIFESAFDAAIFYIVYSAWFLSEIIGAGILPYLRRRRFRVDSKTTSDRGSRGAIFLGLFVSIYVEFIFAQNGVAMIPLAVYSIFFWMGIAFILAGIIIRQWAIITLGRFFSLSVRIAQDQRVIEDGPYKLVRHPSYFGVLLSFVGLGFALESWGGLLVILLVFSLVFGYRIIVEERALQANLGSAYENYMKRTKRLIPNLI